MDYTSLIGPAVVAAVISGLVSGIGIWISARTTRAVHGERLAFERDLAERKFAFDKELAERKFRYDRELHDHRRRAELAERVLADFYRVEEIYRAARGGFVPVGDMLPMQGVSDELATDHHYAPLRRLREHEEFLGKFRARKSEFEAVFGKEAGAPFEEVRKIHNDIVWAVEDVFRNKEIRAPNATPDMRDEYKRLRSVIFSSHQNDQIAQRLGAAVQQIEAICRPAIESAVRS
jgi:hypothetical protein